MAMQQQQGERRRWWQRPGFAESQWVSVFTKWFLTFSGKLARMILIATTLYMSAELYPGVSFPSSLNLAVFIVLSFALDMGGLGLAQIAKKARERGYDEEAQAGAKLAKWLIGIMIAGLVTVSLEHAVDTIAFTKDTKSLITTLWMLVDIALSVARVICAVNYGHVLNDLERSIETSIANEQQQHDQAIEDLQDQLSQALATLDETRSLAQAALDDARSSLETQMSEAQCDLVDAQQAAQQREADLVATIQGLRDQLTQIGATNASLLSGTEGQGSLIRSLQNQVSQAEQRLRNFESVNADLRHARAQIADLQSSADATAHLQEEYQELSANLQNANLHIADLTAKLDRAKNKIVDLQNAGGDAASSAKSRSAKPIDQPTEPKITSIDQARVKYDGGQSRVKISHAEVLEYKALHPSLKNAEVAAHLQISERKVYDALAWQREQDEAATSAQ